MAQNYDCEASKHWRSAYAWWIRAIRAKYPHAQIILTTTILGHDAAWDRAIDEVCRELSQTDGRVHHFLYSKNGCGTPGHVRANEAAEMAKALAAYEAVEVDYPTSMEARDIQKYIGRIQQQ